MFSLNENRIKRNGGINEYIAIAKIFCALLISIILISYFFIEKLSIFNSIWMIISLYIFILILMLSLWNYFQKNITGCSFGPKILDVFILVIFFFSITFIIYFTGAHESNYKNLYFLLPIIYTLRFGLNFGIAVSMLSSAGIVFNDIVLQPALEYNIYLESDLITIAILFLTSWLLGNFIKIEEKHRQHLEKIANIDGLTGLYNHRFFQEKLDWEIKKCRQNRKSLALMMIDIDFFKLYNDSYGHLKGDILLKEFSQIILSNIRKCDTAARYGGDEFTVIFPDLDGGQARSIGERLQKTIKEKFNKDFNFTNNTMSVSIGIALYPEHADNKKDLIKKADEAMYKAKYVNNKIQLYYSVLDDLKSTMNNSEIELLNSIKTLISIINAKDRYTFGHSERVVCYSRVIAEALGLRGEDLKTLIYGAYLHDIGKIEIDREILNKQGALTEDEWEIIKKHPNWGADIIKPISSLTDSLPVILYHHEKLEGSGYPFGLKGREIPLSARILAVADSFDAMTTDRPYKKAMPLKEAIKELERGCNTHFDSKIVKAFVQVIDKYKNVDEILDDLSVKDF